MTTVYDLLVVGAGPAGSACARRAGELGLRCLALERSSFPREKPCAGGLTWGAFSGLDPGARAVLHNEIASVEIDFGGAAGLLWRAREPVIITTTRREFDSHLVERAVAAGAGFEFGVQATAVAAGNDAVTVRAGGREWSGRYLVAADGADGVIRRLACLPPLTQFGAAYVRAFPPTASALESLREAVVFDLSAAPRGYGWVFPKRDHLNVGVYTQRPLGRGLLELLEQFVSTRDLSGWRLEGPLAGRAPARSRGARVAAGRILFAGDAAGLVDPITGEGISHALASGAEAADAVHQSLEAGESAEEVYARSIRTRVLPAVDRLTPIGSFVHAVGPRVSGRVVTSPVALALVARFGPWSAEGLAGGELLVRRASEWHPARLV